MQLSTLLPLPAPPPPRIPLRMPCVFFVGGARSYWVFAHNGDVPSAKNPARSGLYKTKSKRYTPVGDTDSETVFCYFLNRLLDSFPEGDTGLV